MYSAVDDIESLFYVFMYIACDGRLRWKKYLSLSTSLAMKYNVVTRPPVFKEHLTAYAHNDFHSYLSKLRDIIFPDGNKLESRNISVDTVIETFECWINELS